MANKNLIKMAKEHADNSVNAREIESVFALGEHKISAQEYKALEDITALYESTPEMEYENERIYVNNNAVTSLNITDRKLTELPDSISNLKGLQELYVGFNNLQSLPDSISNLKNLQTLYVFNNKYQSLPESIGNLSSLRFLYASSNQFTNEEKNRIKKLFGDRVWV
ncbi:MAG: leucine-rich repeat domain-containing protein [Candidatus Aenigmarchaeota archaeon]|nr:leucine-rich repeat domain-containing protein [Candidatus Aenigmarchaeota archaeon]